MRILSITAQKPHSTGSGVYLMETVRGFKELGHAQAVIAGVTREDSVKLPEGVGFYPVYYNSPELPFPVCGMSDEMPYESTRYRDMKPDMVDKFEAAFGSTVLRAVKEFRPDVVICHHLYLLAAIVREKLPDMAVWGICHGTDLRQMYTNPLEHERIRRGIAGLNRICCLHAQQKMEIVSCYGAEPDKVCVVGNGFNSSIFYDKGERRPHDDIRIVYAGKISEQKGVFCLLRYLKYLGWQRERFSLRLAGGWNAEQHRIAQKLIDDGGFDVTLLGPLSQTRLAEEFNRGDVFVLPSYYGGLPLVIAESMACGMKAVCTDLPGIRRQMEENLPGNGIVFIQPPAMIDADTPEPDSVEPFEKRIAAGIREAAAKERCVVSLQNLTWLGACRRILG